MFSKVFGGNLKRGDESGPAQARLVKSGSWYNIRRGEASRDLQHPGDLGARRLPAGSSSPPFQISSNGTILRTPEG
jgi:hypothetical protein